ncbi:MAG: hypothetical protein LBF15_03160 [Candidatus Peribacteria bacterium]|jgi:hypothetical protein|nr:hypothetical protein [Candidatus Peribacteria bacterium]
MKKIIRYISILLVLSFSLSTSFAGFYDINPATVKAYNLIYQKASKGKIDG